MRFHRRAPLPARVLDAFAAWQRELDEDIAAEPSRPATDRRTEGAIADRHWTSHRQTNALQAAEKALRAMASPDQARCMYCEHDRGAEIDHAEPKSRRAARTFDWENHLWACGACNRQKLEHYHADMVIPTQDDPRAHLDLTPGGRWIARDGAPRGRATLDALPLLNHQSLVEGRSRCRRRLLKDLEALARSTTVSSAEVERFRETATQDPFSDVFASLLSLFALPNAGAFISPAVLDFVAAHPEMHRWLPDADAKRLVDVQPRLDRLASSMRISTASTRTAG
jgi:5-methylcytosine-specific restriction endonuclease McrA